MIIHALLVSNELVDVVLNTGRYNLVIHICHLLVKFLLRYQMAKYSPVFLNDQLPQPHDQHVTLVDFPWQRLVHLLFYI